MKKFIFLIPVIFLILATTLTKNATKQLDKKIFETKENIRVLENRLELVLLDYNFLTSPKKLMEYQTKFFENNLIQLNISNIKNLEDLKKITKNE
jgi:hypothetical protein